MPSLVAIDHVHVFVTDRARAAAWYGEVLGLHPVPSLASWATPSGPLMIRDVSGAVTIALFEKAPLPTQSTIAFRVNSPDFARWRDHLTEELPHKPRLVDHNIAWSIYFEDLFGNPFEITTYEYEAVSGADALV